MKDTLYKLLNKCADDNIDNSEQLSKQEVTEIMKRFKSDVMSDETKKVKKLKPCVSVIIAAAIVSCIGTTVFAANKMGAFDKLKDVKDRTVVADDGREFPINKFINGDYSKVNEVVVTPTEPVTAFANENSRININVDNIYCDGQLIMLGVTGSIVGGNSNNWGYISLNNAELLINGENKKTVISTNYMVLDEGTENSFTGSVSFLLNEKDWFTESSEITVNFSDITVSEMYWTECTSLGKSSLDFEVTPDNSLLKKKNITVEEDGYSMTVYTVSNALLTTSESWPSEMFAMPNTIRRYFDGNGNELTADAYGAMTIGNDENVMCWNTPENIDSITVEFSNKASGEVFKTLTIDLTED